MKYVVVLGDGMADEPIEELGGEDSPGGGQHADDGCVV